MEIASELFNESSNKSAFFETVRYSLIRNLVNTAELNKFVAQIILVWVLLSVYQCMV